MTSFQYWQDQSPPGFFMCDVCFHQTPVEDAAIDPSDGLRVTVCTDCEEEAFGD